MSLQSPPRLKLLQNAFLSEPHMAEAKGQGQKPKRWQN